MKKLLFLALILALLAFGFICYKRLLPNCKICWFIQTCEPEIADKKVKAERSEILAKIHSKAHELKSYAVSHKMNTHIGFLVDMGQHSGQKRFYVVDLQKNSILNSGLVAHGSGNQLFAGTPSFSNVNGSGLSSLGKYKVGAKYEGQFGDAYKLHGLELTNDNAFTRNVVLHSYSCVPSVETYPMPICNSLGCPMVSKGFIEKLSSIIDKEKMPILLWVFM
mgnify:CR=1 FL=1